MAKRSISFSINNRISWLSMAISLGIWFMISYAIWVGRSVEFPSPLTTFLNLYHNLLGEPVYDYSIYQHTLTSLIRWFFAYLAASILGVFIGFVLGMYSTLHKLFMPFIYVLQLVPGLAWIPIALLIFGLGNTSTIFMIFILALTPIVITTSTGIRDTPPDLIDAAILMGADKKSLFIHVLLPSAIFHIIDGMRIGLANSWRVLIAAEMIVGSGIGLGYIIIQSRWSLDYTSAFVSIVIIVLIGLTADKFIFKKIENKLREKYGELTSI